MSDTTHSAEQRRAERGFFPVVFGQDVRVQQGGGVIFLARRNLTIEQGGGQWLLGGGDLTVRQGGTGAMIARRARVEQGFIAALVAGQVELGPGARVLLQGTPAVAVGAALGFLFGWLAGHSGRRPQGA